MRTHKPIGISLPPNMFVEIEKHSMKEGLKRSAWMQQQLMDALKKKNARLTTEYLMAVPPPPVRPKPNPAQRIARARMEIKKAECERKTAHKLAPANRPQRA